MRTLTPALIAEMHQLSSERPVSFLAELIPGTGPVLRVTNQLDNVTFHSLVFESRPFILQAFGEGTVSSPITLQATFGNANQLVSSLTENYWHNVIRPQWTVTLWFIDLTNPDDTPFAANWGVYEIMSVDDDDVAGVMALRDNSISATRNLRQRRYTPTDGFITARSG